jgi:hypothetical protein
VKQICACINITLPPPGAKYGARQCKAQKRNRLRASANRERILM